jgi:hypothetical protein
MGMRRGTADFVDVWGLSDSWFVRMRRCTVGVCRSYCAVVVFYHKNLTSGETLG